MINNIKEKRPLIHCITNPISITQCANAILALGAKPIMAEHPCEVLSITETADALLLNLGNITDARMKSIEISANTAFINKIPFVLDAVGVSCSEIRKKVCCSLIDKYKPSVLKGNYSEIYSLFNLKYKSAGVDTDKQLKPEEITEASVFLASKFNTTVIATGKIDIVTDSKKIFYIRNGVEQLSQITGTGCMLGTVCTVLLSCCEPIESAVKSAEIMGICGELSLTEKGCGTFYTNLLDNLSLISDENINKFKKTEKIDVEEI